MRFCSAMLGEAEVCAMALSWVLYKYLRMYKEVKLLFYRPTTASELGKNTQTWLPSVWMLHNDEVEQEALERIETSPNLQR